MTTVGIDFKSARPSVCTSAGSAVCSTANCGGTSVVRARLCRAEQLWCAPTSAAPARSAQSSVRNLLCANFSAQTSQLRFDCGTGGTPRRELLSGTRCVHSTSAAQPRSVRHLLCATFVAAPVTTFPKQLLPWSPLLALLQAPPLPAPLSLLALLAPVTTPPQTERNLQCAPTSAALLGAATGRNCVRNLLCATSVGKSSAARVNGGPFFRHFFWGNL